MIRNIDSTPAAAFASSSARQTVNHDFLNMLTERFNHDDIPDAHDGIVDSSGTISNGDTLIRSTDCFPVDQNGNHTLATREQVAADFSSFQQMLDEALNEAQISKNPAFEVSADASGKLHISGDHPDREAIEEILNGIPNIRDTYTRMSSKASTVAQIERYIRFNNAYARDPEAALKQYGDISDSEPCDVFSIFVSDNEYAARLESYGIEQDLAYLN